MGQHENIDGLAYTASHPEPVTAFETFVTAYLGFRPDTLDRLNDVLVLDGDMPMAHVARGCLVKLMGTREYSSQADDALAGLDIH